MTKFDEPKRKIAGVVLGGSWDRNLASFTEQDGDVHLNIYRSFQRHFQEDVPWEETTYYETLVDEISSERTWWELTSEADVKERCKNLDKLYHRLRAEGYKTQEEILHEDETNSLNTKHRPAVYHVINGEIAINIGRSGKLIFYDGRHRLAMAKLLNLSQIPVVILVRHAEWQQLRDDIAAGRRDTESLPESVRGHPDLPSVSP